MGGTEMRGGTRNLLAAHLRSVEKELEARLSEVAVLRAELRELRRVLGVRPYRSPGHYEEDLRHHPGTTVGEMARRTGGTDGAIRSTLVGLIRQGRASRTNERPHRYKRIQS